MLGATISVLVAAALWQADVDKSIWTPPVPPAPEMEPGETPRAIGLPTTLYINFDGAILQSGCGNDARYNCSTLTNTFDGYIGPFDGNETQRMAILQATRKDLAGLGVRVVTDRPPNDVEYSMVIYGDIGSQGFAGLAPYIDCNDVRRWDTSFTGGFGSSNTGSTVILQEAAHTWGLEHVDAEFDILNPFKSSGKQQEFENICHKIVANTALEPTSGACNLVHELFCPTGYQNSWQELRYLFGPPVPDTTLPTLEIVSPVEDSYHVLPTTIPLLGLITDDLHPQFYDMQILQNGAELWADTAVELELLLDNPEPGEYELVVRIQDEAGNPAEDTVVFTVLPEGSEPPDDSGDDGAADGSDSGCEVATAPIRPPGMVVFGVLMLLGIRRCRQ